MLVPEANICSLRHTLGFSVSFFILFFLFPKGSASGQTANGGVTVQFPSLDTLT